MRLFLSCLLLALAVPALAQPEVDATLEPFAFLIGAWEGDAWHTGPSGEREPIRQTERVRPLLGGRLLLIEGEGRDAEGEVVYQAVGILSHDAQAGRYYLDAWNDGRHIRADVTPVDGGLDWGFDVGGRPVRYEMRLDSEGRWTEVGRMVMGEGQTFTFVEMTLERMSETP